MPRLSVTKRFPTISLLLIIASYVGATFAAELGDQEYIFKKAREHWAFQPVKASAPPAVSGRRFSKNPIDRFIFAKAKATGYQLSPPAPPRILVRRLYYDLIGMPPRFEEIEKWIRNWSPNRYDELVDHLLASKHHGEHWGRMWLDIARYADTKGYMGGGKERRYPFAYTYRDWVVQALNHDLPYDRFLKLQIAADRMLDDRNTSTNDLAALGFLTVGSRFSGKSHLMQDDRIDVVTRGTLGLTVTCARCHDHMYDPIPTADYWSLYGVFDSSTEPKNLPLLAHTSRDPKASAAFATENAKLQGTVDKFVKGKYDELRKPEIISKYLQFVINSRGLTRSKALSEAGKAKLHYRIVQRWQLGLRAAKKAKLPQLSAWHAAAELYGDNKNSAAKAALAALVKKGENINPLIRKIFQGNLPEDLKAFCDTYAKNLADSDADAPHAEKDREELRQVLRNPAGPTGFPIETMPRYFNRGTGDAYRKLQAKVDRLIATHAGSPPRAMVLENVSRPRDARIWKRGNPRTLGDSVPRQFLAILEGSERKRFSEGSGRLELAKRIADPTNPLTARVIVNRVWMQHFGKPLVSTPSDFGMQTPEPIHRELLDHLANHLVTNGWSLKNLHRLIVNSATFQQRSSNNNTENDPENRYWTRAERRRLSFEATRDSLLVASGELNRTIGGRPVQLEGRAPTFRRAIYGFIDRYDVAPTLRTFDFADPNLHAPKRPETTVPQQALFFMNSPFVEARAKRIADKALKTDRENSIHELYRLIYGRDPTPDESTLAIAEKDIGLPQLAQALLASNEFTFVD